MVTYYIAQLGDPVWVKIGIGWCAAYIIRSRKAYATVKYLTGARERVPWNALRFRKEEV